MEATFIYVGSTAIFNEVIIDGVFRVRIRAERRFSSILCSAFYCIKTVIVAIPLLRLAITVYSCYPYQIRGNLCVSYSPNWLQALLFQAERLIFLGAGTLASENVIVSTKQRPVGVTVQLQKVL